ncbi:hypothetical protein [Arcobacter vandammei]|uniref:hypothetical protein n=1 Tax=Arcobacter vandammei TaxID=2782243 RepID=UPI0018DFE065|nr:hypothetical protein [Arcobacter vandammei]
MAKISLNLDAQTVYKLLPQADPFVFVDKVLEITDDFKFIKAQKTLTGEEDFFRGHFPTKKIFPGVLISEGLAQTFIALGSIRSLLSAGVTVDQLKNMNSIDSSSISMSPRIFYLVKVDIKFIKIVEAGETIVYNVKQLSEDQDNLKKIEVFATTKQGMVAKGILTTYDTGENV